ncbi:hypothetical protein RFI_03697 [Reticulomyxa filosa]|uniref:L domain-like protein n=1 Tax=Reticulomyxa filosa TaxID=46433 RepID=X6P5M2_RETFI|nr:hypothetical protein RFI_03697 [Reticulomyxa filosa]|eukprot:ETO33408.1 hypothetical protein RFI_03697 [Reticulomyxa filosa]
MYIYVCVEIVIFCGNSLTGTIPPEIGNLQLEYLSLSFNELTTNKKKKKLGCHYFSFLNSLNGTIPPEIGNLINLQMLYLYSMNGTIPPEIGKLTLLNDLALSKSQLSKRRHFVMLILLEVPLIQLQNNFFLKKSNNDTVQTNIPCAICKYYRLSGTIPPEIGHLARLEELVLNGNQLSGTIPKEIGNLRKLWILYLYENKLSLIFFFKRRQI